MKRAVFIWILWSNLGCGAVESPSLPMWAAPPEEAGNFTLERYELGDTSCDDARATWTPDHGRLLAGTTGLVSLDGQQTLHHPDPVYDLVSLTRGGVLMATPLGFKVYDHGVHDSPLEDSLNGRGIRRFRKGAEALWMVGDSGLYRWTENQLEQISDIPAYRVDVAEEDQVLIHRTAGNPLLIQRSETGLETAAIPLPGGSQQMTPGPDGRLHARHRDGWWLSLQPFNGESAWHRTTLSSNLETPEDELWVLARDSVNNGLWAVTAQHIVYMTASATTVMPLPNSFRPNMRADVDAYGSLWLACAEPGKLIRVGGPADESVTWNGRIAAFNNANCIRCHDGTGGARNLSRLEHWRDQIDLIVDAVNSQRMPQDGKSLVGGTPSLLTLWQEGGMKE
ncbi:MAG: hypothetical protein CMH58_09980 [Myxococcales bacterium]|nr:hypothetical protein [Myxococcales bacterium]